VHLVNSATDPADLRRQHHLEVGQSLGAFQFLEEVLKMYLWRTFGVIYKRTEGLVSFRWQYRDIENLPLSRLVWHYRKYSDNETLARRILALGPERNRCAHQAYLLTETERNDPAFLQKQITKLEKLRLEVESCMRDLGAEVRRLEATPPWDTIDLTKPPPIA
jgi:hypothetical protein